MVSVVISLYNKAFYIDRALKSVLAQSVQDFEIIVVDDGSTDHGAEIVRRYMNRDYRIRLIRQENKGVSIARNRGITEAKSELIAFLDADDEWKSNFLETILRLYNRFPRCGAFATAYEIVYSDGHCKKPNFFGKCEKKWEGVVFDYFKQSQHAGLCHTSSVAIPKKVFSHVGLFPPGEPLGEDLDMWARIALKFPIAFSTKICARYNMGDSMSLKMAEIKFLRRNRPVVRTLKKAIIDGNVKLIDKEDVKNYLAIRQLLDSRICLIHGKDRKMARKMLLSVHSKNKKIKILFFLNFFYTFLPKTMINFLFKLKREYYEYLRNA